MPTYKVKTYIMQVFETEVESATEEDAKYDARDIAKDEFPVEERWHDSVVQKIR